MLPGLQPVWAPWSALIALSIIEMKTNHPKRKQTLNNRGLPTGQQLRPCFVILSLEPKSKWGIMTMTQGWEGCLHMKVKVRFTPNLSSAPSSWAVLGHVRSYLAEGAQAYGRCSQRMSHSSDEFQARQEMRGTIWRSHHAWQFHDCAVQFNYRCLTSSRMQMKKRLSS